MANRKKNTIVDAGSTKWQSVNVQCERRMMGSKLEAVTIKGFKSIESLDSFELNSLNILIGANGAGKSNFIDFFRLVRALADEAFQRFVIDSGGGDSLFFHGPKETNQIDSRLMFGSIAYEFRLTPAPSDNMIQIAHEIKQDIPAGTPVHFSTGGFESKLKSIQNEKKTVANTMTGRHSVYQSVSNWIVYHFHDTSSLAPMRRDHLTADDEWLRNDASNIAPFLMNLKKNRPGNYELIRDTVRLIAPFFDDFLLRPRERGGDEQVRLEWKQKGSDFPFQPNQLSDGTIRFICLTTALSQAKLPSLIVIDEPELGLHPYAISMLADLIKSASERTQVIISTQSPTLLDYFTPEEIIVVNRKNGRSTFERLNEQNLESWLDDYSVGELWQKNVVRGGPTHE